MPLKDLIASDADRLVWRDMKIDMLRNLLRDTYDALARGEKINEQLLSRIRHQMARG